MSLYVLDTSALVDAWSRYYPPDVMTTLWSKIDETIDAGRISAPKEVLLELDRVEDSLCAWAKERESLFVELPGPAHTYVAEIVNAYPRFVPRRAADGVWADPYIIALAEHADSVVVTGERETRQGETPKIPNVCRARNVDCINILELMQKEGWQF